MAGIAFRAATAADKVAAMQLINAAYMAEAFIKMPFAEERISEETYDACIANGYFLPSKSSSFCSAKFLKEMIHAVKNADITINDKKCKASEDADDD